MRIKQLLPILLLVAGCHNTNPEKGSGGKKVEKHTTLSSSSIVDSAKSILNQSFQLRKRLVAGKITKTDFQRQDSELMYTFQKIYGSLSPKDTMIIHQFRVEKEEELLLNPQKNNDTRKWE